MSNTGVTAGITPAPSKQLLPKDLLLEVELSVDSAARIKTMLEKFQAIALQTAWMPYPQAIQQQMISTVRYWDISPTADPL